MALHLTSAATTAISPSAIRGALRSNVAFIQTRSPLRSSRSSQFSEQPLSHSVTGNVNDLRLSASRRTASITASATNNREESGSSSQQYAPAADFYKVEAIIRPWRVSHVAASLIDAGIRGVTVTDVRGFGSQGVTRERHRGSEFSEDSFVAKVKMEIVVSKDQVEAVVALIIEEARTGEIGDGKIFVAPVADVIRVRTGERGLEAERMIGGRAERLSAEMN